MSSVVFTLQVPAEPPYRALAGDVAARYVEVAGGGGTAAASVAAEVRRAADVLAAAGTAIDLTFFRGAAGLEVVLSCGGRTERVTSPL